jgi:hypothetical protein
MRRYFRLESDNGATEANAQVAQTLKLPIQYQESQRTPMNSHEAFFPPISAEAQKRIRAGLLEIEALWHAHSHYDEDSFFAVKRYVGLAYDVFAQEILSEIDCTDELLEDTLVKLACDAAIENGWIPALLLKWAKSYMLVGRIAAWRAKEIRRELSVRKTPAELLEEFRVREYPNLSHEALADEMGLERSRYYKLKAGGPVRPDAYIRVSDFTKIPVSDLKPSTRL